MLKKLYTYTMELAAGPKALWALFAVSFAESSFFPLPPDPMLIPMVLANPKRTWVYVATCTIASVLGGIVGYAIGYLLYDTIGQWVINAYGYGDKMESFRETYAQYGAWIILIKGLTPIPFKLVTIASGLAEFNFPLFVALSIITRGARFALVGILLQVYGAPIRTFIEKRLELVMLGFLAVIIAGFVIVKYVV